jgi:hypothetical protein
MAESDHDLEFQAPESFEWNDRKAELNFANMTSVLMMRLAYFMDVLLFEDRIATTKNAGWQ